jgi:hypothetical protein
MAALNDLQVKAGDIQNAYLTAPPDKDMATICGPEFVIKRALYGLKSSAHAYRIHLADYMKHLGYLPCLADNDVWYKAETKPDGLKYYAYVLIYVDNILVIHHDAMAALMEINKFFTIKKEGMGDPDIYLGCKLRKHTLPNGQAAWIQSPSKYIEEAVRKAGDYFESVYSMTYPKKVTSPFTPDYRPEMDITEPLNAEKVTFYQSQIGILRWIVEIGRVLDIITEVSLLASQMALPPREGHLMQVFRIFAFLRNRHNGCLVFDPTRPNLKMSSFNNGAEWKDLYGTVEEPIPGNAPPPRGKDVILLEKTDD